MHLSCFKDIIVMSVGLCFAYVFVINKRSYGDDESDKQPFFKYLDVIANSAIKKIEDNRKKYYSAVETLMTKIKYYISTKELKQETEALFKSILSSLDKFKRKASGQQERVTSKIKRRTLARHLGKVSLISGLYGFLVLFLANFPEENTFPALFILNIVVCVNLIICIIAEGVKPVSKRKVINYFYNAINKYMYPTLSKSMKYFICSLIIVIVLCGNDMISRINTSIIPSWKYHNFVIYFTIFSVLAGFIGYFLVSYIFLLFYKIRFRATVRPCRVKYKTEVFKSMVEEHKNELDEIDKKMEQKIMNEHDFSNPPAF